VSDDLLVWLLGGASGFVSGVTGFGSGLVLMGSLVAVMSIEQATVISTVVAIVLAVLNVWSVRDRVPWGAIWPTLLVGAPAIGLGVWLLNHLDEGILKVGLVAIMVAGCGAVMWSPKGRRYSSSYLVPVAGALSGVFNGALGTGGPPLVLFTLLRGWDKRTCKAYLSALFLFMNALRLALLASSGVATRDSLVRGVGIVVPVVVAWYFGRRVFQRVSTQGFRYAGVGLLLLIAGNLVVGLC